MSEKSKCGSCIYGITCIKTFTHNFDSIHDIHEFFRFCNHLCGKFKIKENPPKELSDWDNLTETGEGPWIN